MGDISQSTMRPDSDREQHIADSTIFIPVLDLKDTSLTDAERALLLRDACANHGFFAIKGTEAFFPFDLVREHQRIQEAFFNLPLEHKKRISVNEHQCGYSRVGEETLDPDSSTVGDYREGLYFRRPTKIKHPLQGRNQWPSESDIPGYRSIVEQYIEKMTTLGFYLVELIALALGFERTIFNPFFQDPMITLRPLKYQAVVSNEREGKFACGKHSDYGFLTILYAPMPGLQLLKDGQWVDVKPVADGFIVNIGDMLEHWTGGFMKSTVHRVVNPEGRERFSCPLFFEPDFYACIEPLPGYGSDSEDQKRKGITSGEYLMQKYAATHEDFTNSL